MNIRKMITIKYTTVLNFNSIEAQKLHRDFLISLFYDDDSKF